MVKPSQTGMSIVCNRIYMKRAEGTPTTEMDQALTKGVFTLTDPRTGAVAER